MVRTLHPLTDKLLGSKKGSEHVDEAFAAAKQALLAATHLAQLRREQSSAWWWMPRPCTWVCTCNSNCRGSRRVSLSGSSPRTWRQRSRSTSLLTVVCLLLRDSPLQTHAGRSSFHHLHRPQTADLRPGTCLRAMDSTPVQTAVLCSRNYSGHQVHSWGGQHCGHTVQATWPRGGKGGGGPPLATVSGGRPAG